MAFEQKCEQDKYRYEHQVRIINYQINTMKTKLLQELERALERQDKPRQDKTIITRKDKTNSPIWQDMTRQDKARQDKTREYTRRHDKTINQEERRQDNTRQEKRRQDKTVHDFFATLCRFQMPMAPWDLGSFGPWAHGTMDPWDHGPMGPWHHGTMGPWTHWTIGTWAQAWWETGYWFQGAA